MYTEHRVKHTRLQKTTTNKIKTFTIYFQPVLQHRLENLDRGNMSRVTNLSAGLKAALKVFFNASKK
jgi:hypothetical protein